jgi:hypothetical protein
MDRQLKKEKFMDSMIVLLNVEQKMAAVRMKDGKYAIFQVLNDFNVDHGDIITGHFQKKGGCLLANLTKRSLIKADMKILGCNVASKVKDYMNHSRMHVSHQLPKRFLS